MRLLFGQSMQWRTRSSPVTCTAKDSVMTDHDAKTVCSQSAHACCLDIIAAMASVLRRHPNTMIRHDVSTWGNHRSPLNRRPLACRHLCECIDPQLLRPPAGTLDSPPVLPPDLTAVLTLLNPAPTLT